ncbi:hypothetical protein HK097_011693 [Rhizophlyctis rosea]|uniref:Uncharacterized protein n=1 Tax=Rhizophlyctis rosea TaxID=64517 RepID=A0AAD5S610_9FUNG|nr:hypothetical protein HK097_011693 [Rhizophlyctis rosea]
MEEGNWTSKAPPAQIAEEAAAEQFEEAEEEETLAVEEVSAEAAQNTTVEEVAATRVQTIVTEVQNGEALTGNGVVVTEEEDGAGVPGLSMFKSVASAVSHLPPEFAAKRASQSSSTLTKAALETNISRKCDKDLYDPNVPYIAGFSNGTEQPDPIALTVQGTLPNWLKGSLYRNGPGIFDIEYEDRHKNLKVFSVQHWFDGLGLVHRFQIDAGKAGDKIQYRGRFTSLSLQDLIRQHVKRTGKRVDTDLGHLGVRTMHSDPAACAITQAVTPSFPLSKPHGSDHLVLSNQSATLQEIDSVTLLPKRAFRYDQINPAFTESRAGTCPIRDDKNGGGIVNFTMANNYSTFTMNPSATFKIFSLSRDDQFDPPGYLLAKFTSRPSKSYSCALTKHYIILVEYPYSISTMQAMFAKDVEHAMKFDPNEPTLFHVIDRERRDRICIYRAPSFYAMNIINAYEDTENGGTICIDMNVYETDEIVRCFELQNLRTLEMPPLPGATVRRYCLGKVSEAAALYKIRPESIPEVSDPWMNKLTLHFGTHHTRQALFNHRTDFTLEFPTINPTKQHVEHRYAWGVSITPEHRKHTNMIWDSIVKADLKHGNHRLEWSEMGCFPGEAIMVPRTGTTTFNPAPAEDEGVVMSVVLDSKTNTSFLLFLDAQNMKEVARASLPFAVPFGFHGAWAAAT